MKKTIKEIGECLIIGFLLGCLGLFIIDKWISQSEQETRQVVQSHKQSLSIQPKD